MRLKDISILTPQYTGKPLDTEVSFVPMESLRNGNIDLKEIPYKDAKGKYTFFENGDLLIAKVTPCFENGNIAIANNLKEGIGFGSSEIFVLRFNKNALNTYMFYVSQSAKFQDAACATMCGVGGLKRISPLFMKTYEIDMPSISEQQRIVEYLDEKTKTIDTRISLLEKKSDAYTRLKASVINRAVTRGLNPNVSLKDSGIEWIGMIPEHWEVKRIKDITSLYGRIGFRGYTTEDLVEEGKGAITLSPTNIIGGKIDYNKCSYLSWEKYYESPEIMVENGDIVLVKTASVGKCALVENLPLEATLNPQFVIFKNITCNSKLLIFILQSYVQNYMNVLKIGSVVPTISQAQIYNFKITLPPLSEQQSIASYLDIKCSEIDKAIDNIGKQIDALKRLKRSLINEVVTGKRKV